MQHLERLAIVLADPDLEPGRTGVAIGHDATHLQSANLADQHTVLDGRRRASLCDQGAELLVFGRHGKLLWKLLCDGRQQRSLRNVPHVDRQAKRVRPASECARCLLGQHLQSIHPSANRPRERGAEPARLTFVEQHPTDAPVDRRSAESEWHRLQIAAGSVITRQRTELHGQQTAPS